MSVSEGEAGGSCTVKVSYDTSVFIYEGHIFSFNLGFTYSLDNKFQVPRPENGRFFIKNEKGYIIGNRFSRSTS